MSLSLRRQAVLVALGSLGSVAAAPADQFPRRLQQIEPACQEALEDEPGKRISDVASCALSCLREVETQIQRTKDDPEFAARGEEVPIEWTVETLNARENEYGVTDPGPCKACMLVLQTCAGTTQADQRAAAVRDGRSTQQGWLTLDITAEDFQCLARIDWGLEGAGAANPEKLYQFKMERLCYPAVCSYQDITDLFKYEIRPLLSDNGRTNWEVTTTCDVLATFIDESAPWWILAIGFFYVIGNIALSSTGNPSFLRCMLWCYMAFDIGVGFGLIIYGFLVLSYGNMPTQIKVIFPLFGAVQVTIGGLLSLVMDKGDSRGIKTGICACLAGKTWLLYFSNALALGYGITCLILALIYQITGKTSIEKFMTDFNEQDHEMSLAEKNEMFDFMVQSQTLMITLLIISSLLQFCTIALSTGCPCWENSGGLKRAQQAESMFQLQEDDARSVQRGAKKDREAAKWVEEKRREAGARP